MRRVHHGYLLVQRHLSWEQNELILPIQTIAPLGSNGTDSTPNYFLMSKLTNCGTRGGVSKSLLKNFENSVVTKLSVKDS